MARPRYMGGFGISRPGRHADANEFQVTIRNIAVLKFGADGDFNGGAGQEGGHHHFLPS